jgi:hypothetical protein
MKEKKVFMNRLRKIKVKLNNYFTDNLDKKWVMEILFMKKQEN